MNVARNILIIPKLLPGGGAIEMEISRRLTKKSQFIQGVERWPYRSASIAMEIIPRTLAKNCGINPINALTKLIDKHNIIKGFSWGINGCSGLIIDMHELGVWESYLVKIQTIKIAVETASLLLRIDDIISGIVTQ